MRRKIVLKEEVLQDVFILRYEKHNYDVFICFVMADSY